MSCEAAKFESNVVFLIWDAELFQVAVLLSYIDILFICILVVLLKPFFFLHLISNIDFDRSEWLVDIYLLLLFLYEVGNRSLSTNDDDHAVHW